MKIYDFGSFRLPGVDVRQLTVKHDLLHESLHGRDFFRTLVWRLGDRSQNRYRWHKWTFHRKYNKFEKCFSKIDKKFVSQSILEVGHFTSVKNLCFPQTLIFCIGNAIVKLMDFDDYR